MFFFFMKALRICYWFFAVTAYMTKWWNYTNSSIREQHYSTLTYSMVLSYDFFCFSMFALFLKFGATTRHQDLWPFVTSETGLKFLIWTQGEIRLDKRVIPVNQVHVKRPLAVLFVHLSIFSWSVVIGAGKRAPFYSDTCPMGSPGT